MLHANLGMCSKIVWERSKFVGLQPLNCQFQIQISLTIWSIPLTTLSMSTSTSISNFKIQIQIGKQFVSWYAGGRGNTTQTSEAMRSDCDFHFLKSNQINTNFWQSKPPRQVKIFNFKKKKKKKKRIFCMKMFFISFGINILFKYLCIHR